MDADLQIYGNARKGEDFADSLDSSTFLFSMVMSYTATCEIPGITIAGAGPDYFKFTPPADAEYLHYGHCRTIDGIPVTPDGKPTPALLTKVALESSSIPHLVVNAGGLVTPRLPFIETGLPSGNNIRMQDAMTMQTVANAVDYGRILGRSLAPLADCLIIGESIPAGTTTAMAVLRGLGFHARVSSSMPRNPAGLKEDVIYAALSRMTGGSPDDYNGRDNDDGQNNDRSRGLNDARHRHNNKHAYGNRHNSGDATDMPGHQTGGVPHVLLGRRTAGGGGGGAPSGTVAPPDPGADPAVRQQHLYRTVAGAGDPMIPLVAGMLSSASVSTRVMLAGGTQMAAVLAFASGIGFDDSNVAVGTTSYVAGDRDANFAELVSRVADVPALVVDPGLENSKHAGLRAFAEGYAKEGAGAGGCIISSMIKSGIGRAGILRAADAEYERLLARLSTPRPLPDRD